MKLDLAAYHSPLGTGNRLLRAAWNLVWALLFRPSPVPCFAWRNFLARLFGAKLGKGVHLYPSARIWGPWNLEMGDYSSLAGRVDCYCVDRVQIGPHATVSQYSYLCTATHDIAHPHMRLVTAPIQIGEGAWVCADAFVGPGVKVGEGAVVGARASVFKDVEAWSVVGGNPARFIKMRELSPASRVE